jgi:hypothetical protein
MVRLGIFEPFRALGYITDNVPFVIQRRGIETFVTVSVGKSFQIFNVSFSSSSSSFFFSHQITNVLTLLLLLPLFAVYADLEAVSSFCR